MKFFLERPLLVYKVPVSTVEALVRIVRTYIWGWLGPLLKSLKEEFKVARISSRQTWRWQNLALRYRLEECGDQKSSKQSQGFVGMSTVHGKENPWTYFELLLQSTGCRTLIPWPGVEGHYLSHKCRNRLAIPPLSEPGNHQNLLWKDYIYKNLAAAGRLGEAAEVLPAAPLWDQILFSGLKPTNKSSRCSWQSLVLTAWMKPLRGKTAKYGGLVNKGRQGSWTARCLPVEAGCRSFVARSLARAYNTLIIINEVKEKASR